MGHMFICVCLIWGILGYAEVCAADGELLGRKISLSQQSQDLESGSVVCIMDNLVNDSRTFDSCRSVDFQEIFLHVLVVSLGLGELSLGLGEFVDLEFKIVEDRVRDLKDILMSYLMAIWQRNYVGFYGFGFDR